MPSIKFQGVSIAAKGEHLKDKATFVKQLSSLWEEDETGNKTSVQDQTRIAGEAFDFVQKELKEPAENAADVKHLN